MENQEIKNYLKKFIHQDNKHKDELEKVIETELTDKLLMVAKEFVQDFEKTEQAVYITKIKINSGVLCKQNKHTFLKKIHDLTEKQIFFTPKNNTLEKIL